MTRRLRLWPARAPRRALALLALAGAFSLIARVSGAGWVVVLLCAVAGILVLATVWPVVTLVRTRVELAGSPRDSTAGSTATFSVVVRRAGSGVRLRLVVGRRGGAWVAAVGACQGEVIASPPQRRVVGRVTAELEAAGPLGLMSWRRRVVLSLAVPLEVGPAPAQVNLDDFVGLGTGAADAQARGTSGHDTIRGVRDYATGDPIRIVHWPATARWGEVMVKELEDPTAPKVVIVVDLRGRPDRSEAAASIAAGLAGAALQAGWSVALLTAEVGGPRAGDVDSPVHVGRRLAHAVTDAPPPEPPPGSPTVVRVDAR
ncbi:MAG TPA: DUF58 domain-containing protein [Acidimicrobiales bacterium]|nr:DUF58 domain-containing protein [Acidimicrobiales bacterium]